MTVSAIQLSVCVCLLIDWLFLCLLPIAQHGLHNPSAIIHIHQL